VLDALRRRRVPTVMTLHDYKPVCPNFRLFTDGRPCTRCLSGRYVEVVRHRCLEGSRWRSVAAAAERFDRALAAAGRPAAEVARCLSLDSSPVYSLSSPGAFTDAVGRAAELGFTDVVTHWPRASSWYAGDEKVLETVAGLLPRLRVS
jgi:hypothetical protein